MTGLEVKLTRRRARRRVLTLGNINSDAAGFDITNNK